MMERSGLVVQDVLEYRLDHLDTLTGCQHTQSHKKGNDKVLTSYRVGYSFALGSTLAATRTFLGLAGITDMAAEYCLSR